MRKAIFCLIFLLTLTFSGCSSIPSSVQEADSKALASQVVFAANMNKLFFRSVEAYKLEAEKRADLYVAVEGIRRNLKEASKKALRKDLQDLIDKEVGKVLTKFIEIKVDWQNGLVLRKLVGEFLENQALTGQVYDSLVVELKKKLGE